MEDPICSRVKSKPIFLPQRTGKADCKGEQSFTAAVQKPGIDLLLQRQRMDLNEYPNNITPVMERNYLDIAKRALVIDKKLSNNAVNPGNEIEVNLNFENTSDAGWINGGRQEFISLTPLNFSKQIVRI